MAVAAPKHQCKWRKTAAQLEEKLAERDAQLAALSARVNDIEHKMALANKQIIGPKSERMPTPEQEAKKREGKKPARGGYTNGKKRKENAEALASLPTTLVPHPIAEDDRRCPHCGDDIKPIVTGDGHAPSFARSRTPARRPFGAIRGRLRPYGYRPGTSTGDDQRRPSDILGTGIGIAGAVATTVLTTPLTSGGFPNEPQLNPPPEVEPGTGAAPNGEPLPETLPATQNGDMAAICQLGNDGEEAANIDKNTERIPSASGTAAYRIPDVLDHEAQVIGDVKNVAKLSYTNSCGTSRRMLRRTDISSS